MAISRREALKLSSLAVASSALTACGSSSEGKPSKETKQTTKLNTDYMAPLPDTGKTRVVVVGGGWSGLSIAKNTKIFAPDAEVILVEQRHEFVSCPLSNLWLVDKVELEFLTHDYLQAARNFNYTYFQATAIFDELHADYLEYVPGTDIHKIDLDEKIIYTEFDEYEFEDATFYPHVRGAKILERVGLAKDAKNMMEGYINELTYEAIDAKDIFITGDARPMGFSKSGNTSNSEGFNVAKRIAQRINKTKKLKWHTPTTTCFSAVSLNPEKAIYIYTQYSYDSKTKTFDFADTYSSEDWKKDGITNANSVYDWATGLYFDMFGDTKSS